jgi:phage-related protein
MTDTPPQKIPLVALHGLIKKTRATPDEDLAMARKRQKELER